MLKFFLLSLTVRKNFLTQKREKKPNKVLFLNFHSFLRTAITGKFHFPHCNLVLSTPLRVFSTLLSTKMAKVKKTLCLLISQVRYGKQLTQDYSLVFSYFHVGEMRISSRIYPSRPLQGLKGQNDLLSILIFHTGK